LDEVVVKALRDKGLTLATAESCTGGMLSSRIVDVPGCSDVFLEGNVTYSNEAKIRTLGVNPETLNKYGAVSKETAGEMALGVCKRTGADVGVSITGIAGPDGGTLEKPVGLVFIGLCIKGEVTVNQFNYKGNRERIRGRACMAALDIIRRALG
jgi:nicotinamide-nucleotide amidase